MTLRLAKLQNILWQCSFAQTAQFAASVYSRVIHRMQAWLGEPPIPSLKFPWISANCTRKSMDIR